MNKITIFIFLILICISQRAVLASEGVEGFTHEEALSLGEKMYRTGVLPSGKPMKAYVMEDIPVDGRMFTCDDCHQRSGLGSVEGTIITWPTNAKELYSPRHRTGALKTPESEAEKERNKRLVPEYYQIESERPAYTDATLKKALILGKDPTGRKIDPIMPRYRLNKTNMAILIYYLKHLSATYSPGVDETTIQFATVITENVPEDKKAAMLSVLQANIDAHNAQTRHQVKRATQGPFYKSEAYKSYRKLNLQIWKLQGPEETWRAQLENYYKNNPVFALLGGISSGSWEKIHAFSEENKIPCIFPITDLPVISESDWYTLYFSKGVYQEGESAAKFLREAMEDDTTPTIIQVYQQDNIRSATLAQGFEQTWEKFKGDAVQNLILQDAHSLNEKQLSTLTTNKNPVVLLAWVDDVETYNTLNQKLNNISHVFVSETLLGDTVKSIPEELQSHLLVTHPYSLAGEKERSRFVVNKWLENRNIPVSDFDIQAKMYFLGWMLPGAIKSMRSEYYRDYFLERFDMMIDQDYAIATYPRLTFGTGQRYASKGCYICKLEHEPQTKLVPVSDWVVH